MATRASTNPFRRSVLSTVPTTHPIESAHTIPPTSPNEQRQQDPALASPLPAETESPSTRLETKQILDENDNASSRSPLGNKLEEDHEIRNDAAKDTSGGGESIRQIQSTSSSSIQTKPEIAPLDVSSFGRLLMTGIASPPPLQSLSPQETSENSVTAVKKPKPPPPPPSRHGRPLRLDVNQDTLQSSSAAGSPLPSPNMHRRKHTLDANKPLPAAPTLPPTPETSNQENRHTPSQHTHNNHPKGHPAKQSNASNSQLPSPIVTGPTPTSDKAPELPQPSPSTSSTPSASQPLPPPTPPRRRHSRPDAISGLSDGGSFKRRSSMDSVRSRADSISGSSSTPAPPLPPLPPPPRRHNTVSRKANASSALAPSTETTGTPGTPIATSAVQSPSLKPLPATHQSHDGGDTSTIHNQEDVSLAPAPASSSLPPPLPARNPSTRRPSSISSQSGILGMRQVSGGSSSSHTHQYTSTRQLDAGGTHDSTHVAPTPPPPPPSRRERRTSSLGMRRSIDGGSNVSLPALGKGLNRLSIEGSKFPDPFEEDDKDAVNTKEETVTGGEQNTQNIQDRDREVAGLRHRSSTEPRTKTQTTDQPPLPAADGEKIDILANLAALQREVDAFRGQFPTPRND